MPGHVVGEDETSQIVSLIIDNELYLTLFQSNWSDIARRLKISSAVIGTIRNGITLSQMTPADVVEKIVQTWAGNSGDDATLEVLCQALISSGLRNCADAIKKEFPRNAHAASRSTLAQSQSEKINSNLGALVTMTQLSPTMIAMFQQKGILSQADIATLNSESNIQEKIRIFYVLIQSRTGYYEVLMETLNATNQIGVADLLKM